MSVAHDAASESHTGTTASLSEASFSWTHTPSGTPRGVLVFVIASGVNGDVNPCTGVTYGGSALTATGYEGKDTLTEKGSVKAYFLGSSVPTGARSVVVSRTNNDTTLYAVCFTVTADANTQVVGTVTESENQALTEENVDDGSPGSSSQRYAALMYGGNSSPSAGSNSTAGPEIDFGAWTSATYIETTPGQGSRPVGPLNGNDDVAAMYLAVSEVPGAVTITVPAGSLTLTGYAPQLPITPPAATLALTGYAPTVTTSAPASQAAFVQEIGSVRDATSSTSQTLNVTKTITAGNQLIICFAWYSDTITTLTAEDNLGNTYSLLSAKAFYSSVWGMRMLACNITNGGSLTSITVSFGGVSKTTKGFAVAEYTDLDLASATDLGEIESPSVSTVPFANSATIPAYGIIVGGAGTNNVRTLTAGADSGSPSTAIVIASNAGTPNDPSWALVHAIATSSAVTGFSGGVGIGSAANGLGLGVIIPVAAAAGPVTVTPPAATLTLTGYAPTILLPVTAQPPAATLALTGYAPTILLPVTAQPPAATLALTGYAPVVDAPAVVTPPAATLTLTGYAPAVGSPITVEPPASELMLTGYAPAVSVPVTVTPPAFELTLTGYAPTVSIGAPVTIDVPAAALALTGYAPTVSAPAVVTPPAATLALTGYAPLVTVAVTYYISPTGNDTTGNGTSGSPWATISKFLAVASAGDTLLLRGGSYAETGNCGQTISLAGVTLRAYPLEVPVITDSANRKLLTVNASNVTIDGLKLVGPGDTTYNGSSYGVYLNSGFSSAKVVNCDISYFGKSAVWHAGGSDFICNDNRISHCCYGGVFTVGVVGGQVCRNFIDGIGDHGYIYISETETNAYGIAITMNGGGTPSQNILVKDNYVNKVPRWHGLDTHGGLYIDFIHNEVRNSARAIFITSQGAGERATNCRVLYNLTTQPLSWYPPGTDANVGVTTYDTRYCEVGWNVVGTAYPTIHSDSGGLSQNLNVHDNSRGEVIPLLPDSVVVPAGTLTLTGYAPTVSTSVTISPPAAALTLTGYAPTVQVPVTAAPPAASLTVTGYAPTVGSPVLVTPPAAELALTTHVPTVSAPAVVEVPVTALSLTGYAPAVSVPLVVEVPATTLALTGRAPTVWLGVSIIPHAIGAVSVSGVVLGVGVAPAGVVIGAVDVQGVLVTGG